MNEKEEIEGLVRDAIGVAFKEIMEEIKAVQHIPVFAKNEPQPQSKHVVGGIIRSLAKHNGNVRDAADYANKFYGKDHLVTKALTATGVGAAGGYLIVPEYSRDLIELLYANTVMRKMGATVYPMPTGTLRIPKMATGSQAEYIGEGGAITPSTPTFGEVVLTWKKLAALVPISNDLLRYDNVATDAIIENDLARALGLKEDVTFLRSLGSTNTPKGVLGWVNANNKFDMTATPDLAKVTLDLTRAIYNVMNADIPLDGCGWVFAPRTWKYLWGLCNSMGVPVFQPELNAGKLWGFPYATTSQIPINLGTGANESEVYFISFPDCLIGDAERITVDATNVGTYESGGNLLGTFNRDETVIRAISEHDFSLRYEFAASVIQKVTWGA